EVTSTSNCSDFQARRLNIRIKTESATTPVATLNGTLVAIPRMIVAILENHQQSDGSVILPKALQGLLGMERFTPVAN
ncbi:MAG: serine--tRNA ligase, partial [Actinomycetota bacterium]